MKVISRGGTTCQEGYTVLHQRNRHIIPISTLRACTHKIVAVNPDADGLCVPVAGRITIVREGKGLSKSIKATLRMIQPREWGDTTIMMSAFP